MTIWIDAQLSPALAAWLVAQFEVEATHVRELGLVGASDPQIFQAARARSAAVLTKDWILSTWLNVTGRRLKSSGSPQETRLTAKWVRILGTTFRTALDLLTAGETVVEIKG